MNAVEMYGVHKTYTNKAALENINFTVSENTILGLVGPNGAGKTTLIRIMMGLLDQTSGTVKILNSDSIDNYVKSKIGFCLDSDGVYKQLTGRENLEFIARAYSLSNYQNKINELASYLDIIDSLDKKVQEYSKGMIKKISIIRSIIFSPSLLILDEPLTCLDVETQKKVIELLKHKTQNSTIIISSHILSQIEKLCDEVMILNKKIKYYGGIKNLPNSNGIKLRVEFKEKPTIKLKEEILKLNSIISVEEKGIELLIEYDSENSNVENEIIRIIMSYSNLQINKVDHIQKNIESLYYENVNS